MMPHITWLDESWQGPFSLVHMAHCSHTIYIYYREYTLMAQEHEGIECLVGDSLRQVP
jgi:hypothetical protein